MSVKYHKRARLGTEVERVPKDWESYELNWMNKHPHLERRRIEIEK